MTLPFALESQSTDAFHGPVSVYKHSERGLRVVFASLPGPLVSAQMILPTGSLDDSGLPHTLEHLIFCGSKEFPRRGYLDTLATRSLSTGSNAYTADDHTSYSIATAGGEGLARVLPVLLDHILQPTLTDEQFMTEVYHVDGFGAEQGVVFCEMAGREYTEADLLDLAIRQHLFPNTAYAYECGGKTDSIRNLTNKDIIDYHARFYSADRMTILICGTVDHAHVLEALKHVHLPVSKASGSFKDVQAVEFTTSPEFALASATDTITFPSQDESHGSMVFCWPGPESNDFRTIVALDIVLRLLQDTSASPLYQAFVETEEPWAAEVDYDIKSYLKTAVVIYFSGVGCEDMMDEDDEASEEGEGSDDEEGSEMDQESAGEESDDEDDDNVAVVDPAVFKQKLMSLLETYTDPSTITREALTRTINRYVRKIKEAFEEDPHEVVANYVLPEITRFHLSKGVVPGADLTMTRGSVFAVVEELRQEPIEFWCALIQTQLVDSPVVQITAKPCRQMAADLASLSTTSLTHRQETLGSQGLADLGTVAAHAFTANKVDLPDSVLAAFPSIPNVASLPKLPCTMSLHPTSSPTHPRPFTQSQLVQTSTLFTHLRLAFPIASLPTHLRPYLVLFQELLFQSPLHLPTRGGKHIPYTTVVTKTTETFVSHEAGVGFGNDLWSCGWLAGQFMMSCSSDPEGFEAAVEWLMRVLLFSVFTRERVLSAVQKLRSDLKEVKREGTSLLSAVSTRVTGERKRGKGNGEVENEGQMSVFAQEQFLKGVVKKMKAKKGLKEVVDSLGALQCAIVGGVSVASGEPGFLQVAVPMGAGYDPEKALKMVLAKWDAEVEGFNSVKDLRKRGGANGKKGQEVATAFPLRRFPYNVDSLDTRAFGKAVLVPVEGVTASYMVTIVPCDVLKTVDYYAVTLLAELLSRAEGPLYTSIRGKGYAYDASLYLSAWTGQLSFDVSESSDPYLATLEFHRLLRHLSTDAGFAEIASPFNIETARASVVYRSVTEKSTSGGCIGTVLRRCLRGVVTEEQERVFESGVVDVDGKDLRRVFGRYFGQFLEDDRRVVALVTKSMSGEEVEAMKGRFAGEEVGIGFKVVGKLSEFEIR
ncbi:hypothetical protein HDU98_006362 [Podochytrium sp. JEL0797]|nr:hypothetical protein HDU98_006362 [Podochytrium sp. JEL0797]